MNKLITFDVLVVYTKSLAKSASDNRLGNTSPFVVGSTSESYSQVYGYFLETCREHGLRAAFTTSADIIGAGLCRSYWIYKNKRWHKYNSPCFSSLIFDKFSPTKKKIRMSRDLLFSSNRIKSFNDPELFGKFFDKQQTYNELSEFAIPTVSLEEKTLEGAKTACQKLAKLVKKCPYSEDYGTDLVLKDRYGAGGRRVYKVGGKKYSEILRKIKHNSKASFVVQPMVKFDLGFTYENYSVPTDIRLIYLGGKVVQSYIRRACPGDFRCNEHLGGSLTYLPLSILPSKLIEKADIISQKLNQSGSLYALDFIISNNGNIFLLEGNTGPGLDWNVTEQENEREAKHLIQLIVKELCLVSGISKFSYSGWSFTSLSTLLSPLRRRQ